MTLILQSQVNITPVALLKLAAMTPIFEDKKIIAGLSWIHRSYETSLDGKQSNEKFEYFGWGGEFLQDIPPKYIWKIGEANLFVQDGRWRKTDLLRMRVKHGELCLELA